MRSCFRASRSTSSSRAGRSPAVSTTPASRSHRRSAARRHLPQGRHLPQHLLHHRGQRPAQHQEGRLGGPRRRRHADLRAAHRHAERQSGRTPTAELARRHAPRARRAGAADARHRAEPLDDAGPRAAVPALLRRRRPRPDPAAQRSRSGRARQRPRAAQPAPPHQDDGDHRRDAGGDAAGEPADGEHARHPGRAGHAGVVRRSSSASRRSTCSRTTSAACSTAPTS